MPKRNPQNGLKKLRNFRGEYETLPLNFIPASSTNTVSTLDESFSVNSRPEAKYRSENLEADGVYKRL